MKRPAALLMLACCVALPAFADDDDGIAAMDDPVAMKALSAKLQSEADDIRTKAEADHKVAKDLCWKRFLVSRCHDEVGQAYRDERLKATKLDNRAHAIDRELKRREIAGKDAKREAEDAARNNKP